MLVASELGLAHGYEKKRGPITAAELSAKLEADPEYHERVAKHNAKLEKIQRELSLAEKPIVEELNAAGFGVDSAWGMLELEESYKASFPILLKHLQMDYPDLILETLGRAFGVPEAMSYWDTLVELYRKTSVKGVQNGIAVALSDLARREQIEEIMDLARDPKLRESRIFLLMVLERSRDPRAKEVIWELEDDPDLRIEIAEIRKREERRRRRRLKSK